MSVLSRVLSVIRRASRSEGAGANLICGSGINVVWQGSPKGRGESGGVLSFKSSGEVQVKH